jgi:hypothetical protein
VNEYFHGQARCFLRCSANVARGGAAAIANAPKPKSPQFHRRRLPVASSGPYLEIVAVDLRQRRREPWSQAMTLIPKRAPLTAMQVATVEFELWLPMPAHPLHSPSLSGERRFPTAP